MTQSTRQRLFGVQDALDHPVTFWVTVAIIAVAVLSGLAVQVLRRTGILRGDAYQDAYGRWKSWIWLSLMIVAPILLGAAWVMGAVMLLSLGCYREYARATGLVREKSLSAVVVVGILMVTFANFDHYDRLFFAAAPATVSLLAVITIPADRPRGYIQRVGLAVFGFLIFGFSLSYIGNIANDARFRPILLMMFLGVELNDIFAYCSGKLLGRRNLVPITSPGKTVAGSIGALVLTTAVVALMAHFVFHGTPVDTPPLLIALGVIISTLGQLGDLVLSSIKRDIGIKDIGVVIPGHGGLLDRFDSLVLVPPAVYHLLSYQLGPLGADQQVRIFTGG